MKVIKIKEIADFIPGQSPKSKYYSNDVGTPFLQGSGTFSHLFPKIKTHTTKVTKLAKKGDILISVRAPVGDLNMAPIDLCIGRGLGSLRAKNGKNKFLYYNLLFNKENLRNHGSGTTYAAINKDIINDFKIFLPKNHKNIGNILFSYDEKIELNNQIITELESLTKLIYEYWFIQFDFPDENGRPYKTSGGRMVWNEKLKREIPEGWEVRKLQDLVSFTNKKTSPDENRKLIDLSIMNSNSLVQNKFNLGNFSKTNLYEVYKGDILFGSIRPYLNKYMISPINGIVAGSIHRMRVKEESYHSFIVGLVMSQYFLKYAIINSEGTKMPVIKKEILQNLSVPYNKNIISKFNNIITLSKVIPSLIEENQKLKKLRDFLLPLLMNGQVTINE